MENVIIVRPPRLLGSISISLVPEVVVGKCYRLKAKHGLTVDYDSFFATHIRDPFKDEKVSTDKETKFHAIQVLQDMSAGSIVDLIGLVEPAPAKLFLAVLYKLVLDNRNGDNPVRGLSMVNANLFKVEIRNNFFASVCAYWISKKKCWGIISEEYSPLIMRHRGNILYSLSP